MVYSVGPRDRNHASIEEERRLLYVAMTRAKDHLTLVVPQRFYVHQQGGGGDRHIYASPTRFLPESLAPHFDISAWPVAAPGRGRAPVRSPRWIWRRACERCGSRVVGKIHVETASTDLMRGKPTRRADIRTHDISAVADVLQVDSVELASFNCTRGAHQHSQYQAVDTVPRTLS